MLSAEGLEQHHQRPAAASFRPCLTESQYILSFGMPATDPGFQHRLMVPGTASFPMYHPHTAKSSSMAIVEECDQFHPRFVAVEPMQIQFRLYSPIAAPQPAQCLT